MIAGCSTLPVYCLRRLRDMHGFHYVLVSTQHLLCLSNAITTLKQDRFSARLLHMTPIQQKLHIITHNNHQENSYI